MIDLRPHHLLCILNFIGKGYTEDFVRHYESLVERINQGERHVRIVEGPDSVCSAWVKDSDPDCHCHEPRIHDKDMRALSDLEPLIPGVAFGAEFEFSPELIGKLREAFRAGTVRGACDACPWYGFCTDIAKSGYEKTKLLGKAPA